MVEEYVAWYDLHVDPAWQDILFAPPASGCEPLAWAIFCRRPRRI